MRRKSGRRDRRLPPLQHAPSPRMLAIWRRLCDIWLRWPRMHRSRARADRRAALESAASPGRAAAEAALTVDLEEKLNGSQQRVNRALLNAMWRLPGEPLKADMLCDVNLCVAQQLSQKQNKRLFVGPPVALAFHLVLSRKPETIDDFDLMFANSRFFDKLAQGALHVRLALIHMAFGDVPAIGMPH